MRGCAGSSPLAWGTGGALVGHEGLRRIIPARVGNGSTASVVAVMPSGSSPLAWGTVRQETRPTDAAPDHPRSRGERWPWLNHFDTQDGSSPLAWGTVALAGRGVGHGRIIPARVGNGRPCGVRSRGMADHPRSRGERLHSGDFQEVIDGSSPLAWGTDDTCPRHLSAHLDHPRSRGERSTPSSIHPGQAGSSPLAWGTVQVMDSLVTRGRIIPARVGNGCQPSTSERGRPDHPRSRGERDLDLSSYRHKPGSSPLAWGTAQGQGRSPAANPDHPRSRGERWSPNVSCAASFGSSPLAWGTGLLQGRPARE